MWQQYRKTALVMQISIVAICAGMAFYLHYPWPFVIVTFLVMQLAAIAGAWWGLRLRKKIEKATDELPLNRNKRS